MGGRRARVDEEDGKPPAILGPVADLGEEQRLLVVVQIPYASRALLLPAELGKAVDVAHLVSLAEQLAQRRKFPVDGRIAVAVLAEPADQEVQCLLAECAEFLAEQKLVQLSDEGGDVVFVRSVLPEEVAIFVQEVCEAVFGHGPNTRSRVPVCYAVTGLEVECAVQNCLFRMHNKSAST